MPAPDTAMPDYGEILQFLARNPPQLASERHLHASLLELLAHCLRGDALTAPGGADEADLRRAARVRPSASPRTSSAATAAQADMMREAPRARAHHHWVHFN